MFHVDTRVYFYKLRLDIKSLIIIIPGCLPDMRSTALFLWQRIISTLRVWVVRMALRIYNPCVRFVISTKYSKSLGGGTGIRGGLKNLWVNSREGSSPSLGTVGTYNDKCYNCIQIVFYL